MKTLTIATLLCLSLMACKKEYPTIYMSDEMKQYVMQPVGTWWVYQDSATGVLDSVSLENQMTGIERGDGDDIQYDWEYLNNVFFSSKHRTIREGTSVNHLYAEPLISYSGLYGHYADKLSVGESNETHIFVSYYDSLLIGGQYYKKVKYFRGAAIAYMAPNIGVIRTEWGGKKWNLVRYHIKK